MRVCYWLLKCFFEGLSAVFRSILVSVFLNIICIRQGDPQIIPKVNILLHVDIVSILDVFSLMIR